MTRGFRQTETNLWGEYYPIQLSIEVYERSYLLDSSNKEGLCCDVRTYVQGIGLRFRDCDNFYSKD